MSDLTVLTIETPSLGDRSYLVHDGEVAFVVDPQRDVDRVLDLLEEHGVRLTHVLETHLHNDYLTGGAALARRTGAAYVVNGADGITPDHRPVADGSLVEVGPRMRLLVLATPGHTFTHLAYALHDEERGEVVAVFSGGSLLFGSTGRPDLLGSEHAEELARHQHDSVRRLADLLPVTAAVHPTHGFGSFCSAGSSGATASTLADEQAANPALRQDRDTWVRETLASLGPWPAYYAHMAPGNAAGPTEPDLSLPPTVAAADLGRRLRAGEWVVDLRDRTAYAAGHAPGTLNFGLDGPFATYLGWLVPWGTPLTLLADRAEDVTAAQRELVRIGIDRPAAHATGDPRGWTTGPLAGLPRASFADLAQVRHHREVVVLDVRRADEHHDLRIQGALNVPLHELPGRLDGLPPGELWVHCAGGYRASVGASLLDAAGRAVVAVDDAFDQAPAAGLPVTGPAA